MNPPSASDITLDLCRFVSEQLFGDGREIAPDAVLADLGLDSFALMELVLFIEKRFGIQVPLSELSPANVRTVAALSECAVGTSVTDPRLQD